MKKWKSNYRKPKRSNREELQSMSDALKEFVQENKLEKGLTQVNIRDIWNEQMGSGIKSYTTAVQLKRDTLYVRLNNSVLRQELSYGKSKIITMMNEALGKEVIKKIVLA